MSKKDITADSFKWGRDDELFEPTDYITFPQPAASGWLCVCWWFKASAWNYPSFVAFNPVARRVILRTRYSDGYYPRVSIHWHPCPAIPLPSAGWRFSQRLICNYHDSHADGLPSSTVVPEKRQIWVPQSLEAFLNRRHPWLGSGRNRYFDEIKCPPRVLDDLVTLFSKSHDRQVIEREIPSARAVPPVMMRCKPARSHCRGGAPGIYCLESGGFVKVGMSATDAESRAESQTCPTVGISWIHHCTDPKSAERAMHQYMDSNMERVRGEWFQSNGVTSETLFAIAQNHE